MLNRTCDYMYMYHLVQLYSCTGTPAHGGLCQSTGAGLSCENGLTIFEANCEWKIAHFLLSEVFILQHFSDWGMDGAAGIWMVLKHLHRTP